MWILGTNGDLQTRGRHGRIQSHDSSQDRTSSTIAGTSGNQNPQNNSRSTYDDNRSTESTHLHRNDAPDLMGTVTNLDEVQSNNSSVMNETSSTMRVDNDETDILTDYRLPPSEEIFQLSAEREVHRRKSSTCMFLLGLFLFRLWVEAILSGDVSLIIVSSLFSSYFIAWSRHSRAVLTGLNNRIEELSLAENQIPSGRQGETSEDEEGGSSSSRRRRNNREQSSFDFSRSDHIDMDMLSFQAQLAFAIMESQRYTAETGGHGRPDDENNSEMQGVSDSAKKQWETFPYDVNLKNVKECADLKPHKNESPSCCICLCEYEEGELLNQMRCGHVYHKECIESWCQNHTRCPLCNVELNEENDVASIV